MERADVILSAAPSDPVAEGDIERSRLIDQLSELRGLVLVEAPSGFGKSTLAQQLIDSGRWEVLDDGGVPGPNQIAVYDDVDEHTLDLAAATAIDAEGLVICLARSLPTSREIRRIRSTKLRHVDLRFDLQEVHRLLRQRVSDSTSDQAAYLLHTVTDGWPEHVERVIDAMAGSGSSMDAVRSLATRGIHLEPLIERCLDALTPEMTDAFVQLAHLGRFSVGTAHALIPRLAPMAMHAGFPILENHLGELVIPELVAGRLTQIGEPDPATLRRLIPLQVGTIGAFSAARALLAAGAADQAADLICALPEHHIDESNQTEAIGMLRAIEAREPPDPALTLRRARVHRNLAQLGEWRNALEAVAAMGDPRVAVAADVELLMLSMSERSDIDQLSGRLDALAESMHPDADRSTRIRFREARALLLANSGRPGDIQLSVDAYREVAAEWEMLGDRPQSASALRRLAAGPLMHLGRFGEAATLVDHAMQLQDSTFGMTASTVFRCRMLALCGRVGDLDHILSHAEGLTGAIGLNWLTAYVHWSRMQGAALTDDPAGAHASFAEARSYLGELRSTPTGQVFLGEAAQAFAVLGLSEDASRCLDEIRASDDITVVFERAIADLALASRAGDIAEATRLSDELLANDRFPPDRTWRLWVEQVIAHRVNGAELDPGLEERLARALESAARLGVDELAERLLSDSEARQRQAALQSQTATRRIRLLGDFSVHAQGSAIQIPEGNIATLLKLLSIVDEPRPVELVIDRLWPDASLDVGRRRLKNVLSRLRKLTPENLVLRSATTLRLADDVETDLGAFRHAAQRATREVVPTKALQFCVEALNLYQGPLLPADLYDDEIGGERAHAEHLAGAVLEVLLNASEPSRLSPLWLFETASRLEAASDQTFVQIAQLALDSGAESLARSAMARAARIAEELGVPLLCDEKMLELLDA